MRRMVRWSGIGASALLLAGPAMASHGPTGEDFVPNLRQEKVYFHCTGTGKIHNSVADGPIRWNTTAPTASVQAGAGCASIDNGLYGNNQVSVQDAHFDGTFDANLDTLTVEAHQTVVGPSRAGGPVTFNVRLAVDGASVFGASGRDVTMTATPSSSGATQSVKFTITNIGLLDELNDTEHTVLLSLSGGAFLASAVVFPVRDTQTAWVYDTTEVPSGLTFNPTTPAPVKVKV